MPMPNLDKLLEEYSNTVKKVPQLKQKIDNDQKELDKLNAKADSLDEKIKELRKPSSGKPNQQKREPSKAAKPKPGESLTDRLLELCQNSLSRSEIIKKLGDKFKAASIDSTLSTLKLKGSKGRKLLYKDGKYQVAKAMANVKGAGVKGKAKAGVKKAGGRK